jgi:hypothetical protein
MLQFFESESGHFCQNIRKGWLISFRYFDGEGDEDGKRPHLGQFHLAIGLGLGLYES